jgi:hypothetical protein
MTDKRHDRRALAVEIGDQETPKAGQVSLSAAALLVHDGRLRPESGLGVARTWYRVTLA